MARYASLAIVAIILFALTAVSPSTSSSTPLSSSSTPLSSSSTPLSSARTSHLSVFDNFELVAYPGACLFAPTSSDAGTTAACNCEVYCCSSCVCGVCCDSWARDSRTDYWMYSRPHGSPVCSSYCGYRMAIIIDCGCRSHPTSLGTNDLSLENR